MSDENDYGAVELPISWSNNIVVILRVFDATGKMVRFESKPFDKSELDTLDRLNIVHLHLFKDQWKEISATNFNRMQLAITNNFVITNEKGEITAINRAKV